MRTATERYLAELRRELRRLGVPAGRFLEETRGHLADGVEAGRARGLSPEEAEHEAVARYGDPRMVAAKFAAGKNTKLEWGILASSFCFGLCIAGIDSRPHWDDAGITAGMLLLSAAVLGLMGPRRPWRWALGIGVWIPAFRILHAMTAVLSGHVITRVGFGFPDTALIGLFVLAISMTGAYAGMAVRKLTAVSKRGEA